MPTDHERERNRAKQKRFQKRHPGYIYNYVKQKRLRNPQPKKYTAKHRTFELADPRDEERLPRLIGYCKITTHPVWSALWAVKDISNSRWAAWFRELAALGLTPVERFGWACGSIIPINRHLAHRLVAERVRHINRMTKGNPYVAPPWLLRTIEGARGRYAHQYSIGRLFSDGRVERFTGMKEAARIIGISTKNINMLTYWIHTASMGADGCVWFDD